ncbi:MAG: DUF1684 domain-containing protein [Bernardetiaceae bacterium]|jgi:hypothetical protein|nr:DUF1684 domain-containing protein [Bernardetiaceae bacterium]
MKKIAFWLCFGCLGLPWAAQAQAPAVPDSIFAAQWQQWHTDRQQRLQQPDGWLNLAGLYWLQEGPNTFGAAASNQIRFPAGRANQFLGTLTLQNGEVTLQTAPNAQVMLGQQAVRRMVVYHDQMAQPPLLAHRALRWLIIKRGSRYALRLRDLESDNLLNFNGVEAYSPDARWVFAARLEPAAPGQTLPITDVTGQTTQQPLAGYLVFAHQGKTFRLAAQPSEGKLFIMFKDATTPTDTYPAGRFLYTEPPDPDGLVRLDFNRAINPPCAFTDFATCPLPPAQNTLPFAVMAGEKRYGQGHD